jgi:DUF1680 family protein
MRGVILAFGMAMSLGIQAVAAERDYPIRPVPFTAVKVEGEFWKPRIETNRDVTVWYDFHKCEETGRIDNFAVAGGLKQGGFRGIFFDDSDVFKVIEGASYCLAGRRDPKLEAYLDDLIAKIAAAQEDDGYLYTARTINDPNYDFPGKQARWSQLASSHELYNVGHLYEAAVAHWQATGKRSLLDVAIKNAELVCRRFGRGEGQQIDVPGHQEIEIGLVKLYRATGDAKYLQQAKFFIDMRGRSDLRKTYGLYAQDHRPVVQQDEAVGHAVRAGYLYAGMADVAALTGDETYIAAIDRIWENIVSKKMYLTGGVGASAAGEAFGANYELPNPSAYNETCAAIAQALFNHRMFLLHGDAKYIDVLERIVYNGFLSGVSLSGDQFFYPNPLACDGRTKFNHGALGRSPWFGVSCCPVNVVRFTPSIAGYVYAVRDDDLYVNLFVGGEGEVRLGDGAVAVSQETNYPWEGRAALRVSPAAAREFTLRVRIPGWARGKPIPSDLYHYAEPAASSYTLKVNGEPVQARLENGCAALRRNWKPGDVVELNLPMPVRRVVAHPAVKADEGRVALERGPVVYCLEAVDNGGSVSDLFLPDDAELTATQQPDLLGGIAVIRGEAKRASRGEDGGVNVEKTTFTAVPYYAWAHRHVGEMAVWLPREESGVRLRPAPTIASQSRPSASHVWQNDTAEALNDQLEPANSLDHDIPRHTWWDHTGTREWVQYDFAQPATVSAVEVYWFDDTGRGRCRVPKSWRLLYRDGEAWKPTNTQDEYGVSKDRYNVVRFQPVKTAALRIEVQLQGEFSGGVLEWKVR